MCNALKLEIMSATTTNKRVNSAANAASTNNTNATKVANALTNEYANVTGRITAVTIPKVIDGRVTISLDCEPFESLDFETGEVIMKTAFGLNTRALVSQVQDKVEAIGVANALAMGRAVNPQIISLSLIGAEIEVTRTFHAKGEKRQESNETYSRDCIVSEIVKVTPHIKPMFENMLNTLLMSKPYLDIVTTGIVRNPFGI